MKKRRRKWIKAQKIETGGGQMMNKEHMELENVEDVTNRNPLSALESLQGVLSREEEHAFMQILFSSSATISDG